MSEKCIKCGEPYDITETSTADNWTCSPDTISKFCPKCRPIIDWKAVYGLTCAGGVLAWFWTSEVVLKPTIRTTRKLFKGLSDWAEK